MNKDRGTKLCCRSVHQKTNPNPASLSHCHYCKTAAGQIRWSAGVRYGFVCLFLTSCSTWKQNILSLVLLLFAMTLSGLCFQHICSNNGLQLLQPSYDNVNLGHSPVSLPLESWWKIWTLLRQWHTLFASLIYRLALCLVFFPLQYSLVRRYGWDLLEQKTFALGPGLKASVETSQPLAEKDFTLAQSCHILKWANPDIFYGLAGPQNYPRVCRFIPCKSSKT